MARIVAGGGGDILKFAGDAMIVLWPQKDDIQKQICRAVQCGLEVQSKLNNARLTTASAQEEVVLSVKIVSSVLWYWSKRLRTPRLTVSRLSLSVSRASESAQSP